MRYELVCRQEFGDFKRGDVITDPVLVAKYLDETTKEHHKLHHFVKRAVKQ